VPISRNSTAKHHATKTATGTTTLSTGPAPLSQLPLCYPHAPNCFVAQHLLQSLPRARSTAPVRRLFNTTLPHLPFPHRQHAEATLIRTPALLHRYARLVYWPNRSGGHRQLARSRHLVSARLESRFSRPRSREFRTHSRPIDFSTLAPNFGTDFSTPNPNVLLASKSQQFDVTLLPT
jgi:hypothetical protein